MKFIRYLQGKFKAGLYKYFIFALIIFCSCDKQSHLVKKLPTDDRRDIESVMNYFLFDHHAVFVLFGKKPMSEIVLYPLKDDIEEKKLFDSLPEEIRAQAKIIKCPFSAYECWKVWKRNQGLFELKGFILAERTSKLDPSAAVVYIVNIDKTIEVLQKNYGYFKGLFGHDFTPSSQIYDLENPSSQFWEQALSDHFAQGILFGYGEKNAQVFAKGIQGTGWSEGFRLSTSTQIAPYKASCENFTIPKFRTFLDDEIIQDYEIQKRSIEQIYSKGSSLEITLKKLTGYR